MKTIHELNDLGKEDFFCNIEEKKEYLTKGINHTNEIETSTYVYGTQEQQEISLKKMIISCYTYREMYSSSLTKYKEILGEELYNEILTEQVKFFDEKYIIKSGVFNDGEGCSYNSLTLKN